MTLTRAAKPGSSRVFCNPNLDKPLRFRYTRANKRDDGNEYASGSFSEFGTVQAEHVNLAENPSGAAQRKQFTNEPMSQ